MTDLSREQLKAIFAKRRFLVLPEELQGDILDSAHPSGVNTTADDWNELKQKERDSFLDQYSTEDLKRLKMAHMKEDELRQQRDLLHNKISKVLGRSSAGVGAVTIVDRDGQDKPMTITVDSSGFLEGDLTDLNKAGFQVEFINASIVTTGSGGKIPQTRLQLVLDENIRNNFNPSGQELVLSGQEKELVGFENSAPVFATVRTVSDEEAKELRKSSSKSVNLQSFKGKAKDRGTVSLP